MKLISLVAQVNEVQGSNKKVEPKLLFFHFFKCLFIFERERDREGVGEEQRKRETQNPKIEDPGSELSVQSPTWSSNSQTVRS